MNLESRRAEAERAAREAGTPALRHFRCREALEIGLKRPREIVSEAGRAAAYVDRWKRRAAFRDDGVPGEGHGWTPGMNGFHQAIDPIHGTESSVTGSRCIGTIRPAGISPFQCPRE
ncbi:MAG: hypothetical protein F4213_03015 [Boseongicola sp. SB0677_bin_26]|nr:hypothetical protein [Boseongicola sp. SB0665_bin_10]MYG24987.1 hypothetical protein [Boseongicola sp. SB0677_bin_26]